MKILEDKYPKGTLHGQRTAGRYIDENLYENLKILANSIQKDMTFLTFIYSSTLEVGTGKSVFASQLGEAWTDLVNTIHNKNIPFGVNNCVFRPKDLIERSFKVPKFSMIWLDEWEDLHFMSELGMSLRQFFRKCRQLNLFIVCIIPNFFQLPISYAISRSVCAIDVRFGEGFERGYFGFYNFQRKKELYIKGRKTQDYNVVQPNFSGRFVDGYAIDEKAYRSAKYRDMIESEEKNKKPTEKQLTQAIFKKLHKNLTEVSMERLSEAFGISRRTGYNWLNDVAENQILESVIATEHDYYNSITDNPDVVVESGAEEVIK